MSTVCWTIWLLQNESATKPEPKDVEINSSFKAQHLWDQFPKICIIVRMHNPHFLLQEQKGRNHLFLCPIAAKMWAYDPYLANQMLHFEHWRGGKQKYVLIISLLVFRIHQWSGFKYFQLSINFLGWFTDFPGPSYVPLD